MAGHQQAKPPLPELGIRLYPTSGYLRIGGHSARVIFAPNSKADRPWQPCRFVFHSTTPDLRALVTKGAPASRLQQQLEQAVSELQDEELDDSFQPMCCSTDNTDAQQADAAGSSGNSAQHSQQQHSSKLSWRAKLSLQVVGPTGPGSRAYQHQGDGTGRRPKQQQQLTAVVPLVDFCRGDLIGLYLVSGGRWFGGQQQPFKVCLTA